MNDCTIDNLLERALLLDLEVGTAGNILQVGARLGAGIFHRCGRFLPEEALTDLATFATAAEVLVGHNILEHDLSFLRRKEAAHPILSLPVIDTLVLSPLCFPQNPYHRLVKDYKLMSESRNDPVSDANLCGVLLREEYEALQRLQQIDPDRFAALHFLLAQSEEPADYGAAGFELLFRSLASARPSTQRALDLCNGILPRWGCSNFRLGDSVLSTAPTRMALAYTMAWLPVAGATSVLPPWVRLKHPLTRELIRQLREIPCSDPGCGFCREVHDPDKPLQKFFGFDSFRTDPQQPGESLQRKIVDAGMRNQPLLAILPTGGGKSLCFQLPALVRNFRSGALTIVISPLQALMKDQVDGLTRRTGTPFAAALYGMLTAPERADVLRRIALGDLAILYVSPEQLRNKSFCDAIAQREIGCWVFDEAHCFSKWGHDFRSDYLYAGRFIREFSTERRTPIPSVACFTATAKQDVKAEILHFFETEVGQVLQTFEGGVERTNLIFEVQRVTAPEKLAWVDHLLSEQFALTCHGSAIVFRSKRKLTEESAEFLRAKGWRAAHFHAGLTPSEKKEVQEGFLKGHTQVICATNAFGMGIDKEDVRLVIHADTPGSLENYLQEAGRAGRDQKIGRCVLLYDDQDAEWQFRMSAFSELTRRDIGQILRTLRKARHGQDEVVITTGEILRDEEFQGSAELDGLDGDTKVRTGISWLERAGFILRNENVTTVFQARLLVQNLEEAQARMEPLNLSESERRLWTAILRTMINAESTDLLSVDQLAALPEFSHYSPPGRAPGDREEPTSGRTVRQSHDHVSRKILKILRNMAQSGLVKRDTLLTAFIHYKIANHSGIRLQRALAADRKLVETLAIAEPDPEGWLRLSLPLLNQKLSDEGVETSPELVRQLLKSLQEDGRGFAGGQGSIELRYAARDAYRVKVNRAWRAISELAEKRRRLAELILNTLLAKVPAGTEARSDLLIDFTFEELANALDRDLLLRSEITDIESALERSLMYLHEQGVLILRQGLAIFRSAMTIRFRPEAENERYRASDYQPLEHFYKERKFQVHIMGEYARRALVQIQDALKLVVAYFSLSKDEFIRRYFSTKKELLDYATGAESFKRIVTDLANHAQIRIVSAPAQRNMLILAGPGSGKSKVVVHRCAWLLRVKRVRPQSILVCCFNRQAAIDLRHRLSSLVGDDARGVVISTYHSLAMRLLGRSFAGARNPDALAELGQVIPRATQLLRGESVPSGVEPNDLRDRLLAGFEYILVDEYQDIDHDQYELISAIAGRTLDDSDLKLSIMAVGDDDQNIYTFRGANVQFIRRFQEDYQADIHYLVENYRSTSHLIAAANQLIEQNRDRMKGAHAIRINSGRTWLPPGGDFTAKDPLTGGRVQIMDVPDFSTQSSAVIIELKRVRDLGVCDWSRMAVLSRTHRELAAVRTVAERESIPVRWCADRLAIPPLHQVREIYHCLEWLRARGSTPVTASVLLEDYSPFLSSESSNPWMGFIRRAFENWKSESLNAELPTFEATEFFWSLLVESRGNISYGDGVTLSTIHAAKGTEYNHVILIGKWPLRGPPAVVEESRRLLYVGMTRARESLSVFERRDPDGSLLDPLTGPEILREDRPQPGRSAHGSTADLFLNYSLLGLESINLGFAGLYPDYHPIHQDLAELQPGNSVTLAPDESGIAILNSSGRKVGRLSRKASSTWAKRLPDIHQARVLAIVRRTSGQEQALGHESALDRQVTTWEAPIIEIVERESQAETRYPGSLEQEQ